MRYFKQLFCKHNWNWVSVFVISNYFTQTGYELTDKYICDKCLKVDYNIYNRTK